jgi:tRNA-Thr(GGU) m(6)t(6)A37 methyltransferase TsaA
LLKTQAKVRGLETELAKAQQLRTEERKGRTAAERRLREHKHPQHTLVSSAPSARAENILRYQPIGYLESPFRERRGTPRQGGLAPSVRSKLRLLSSVVQAAALEGIEGFSHCWLIWDFHENTNIGNKTQVKAKIKPPGLRGEKIGLFATRTPHRPNPIGLTLCKLIRLEGEGDKRDTLILGGADLIDNTPILDVKPYLGHDIVDTNLLRVPPWCATQTDSSLIRRVFFEKAAEEGMHNALASNDVMQFYRGVSDAIDLQNAISETLLLDIRSVHQGRGKVGEGQQYHMCLDGLEISFQTYEAHIVVTSIRPLGYK